MDLEFAFLGGIAFVVLVFFIYEKFKEKKRGESNPSGTPRDSEPK